MYKILFLSCSLLLISSCKNEEPEALAKIHKMESDYQKSKDPKELEALLSEYIGFITGNAGEKADKIHVLENAEKLSTANNRYFETVTFLNTLIKEDPQSSKTGDRIWQLADLMKNIIRNESAANTLLNGFLDKYPNHAKASEATSSLGGKRENLKMLIQNLASKMYVDSLHQFDETAATQYVDATEAFVLINPDDLESPELLNKAAETARSLKTFSKAISLYDWVIEKYPTSKIASQALFLKAFTYDNELRDVENAKFFYQEFIKRYPADDFADDAKVLMENLGKSDEDFLQSIQKGN